jgi:hypothetical protein
MMKISDLAYHDDWSIEPMFWLSDDKQLEAIPNEYDWLLKGDPKPFIDHLKKNPDKMKIEWVQNILFDALENSTKSKASRPALKKTDQRNIEILKDMLIALSHGANQTNAMTSTGIKYHLSYTAIRDVYKPVKARKVYITSLVLELVKDKMIEPNLAITLIEKLYSKK